MHKFSIKLVLSLFFITSICFAQNEEVSINFNKTLQQNTFLEIYNLQGKLILPKKQIIDKHPVFNLTTFSSGIYILKITNKVTSYYSKRIKK